MKMVCSRFEVNFGDERHLPFEGAGAVRTWTLELNRKDNRQIDFDTITDVILHLKYTSRFGVVGFQKERRSVLEGIWPSGTPDPLEPDISDKNVPVIQRLFLVKDEFPAEWRKFVAVKDSESCRHLVLKEIDARLPYILGGTPKEAVRLKVFSLGAEPLPVFDGAIDWTKDGANAWKNVSFGEWGFKTKADAPQALGLLVECNIS